MPEYKPQPDPQEFAKSVLRLLASLQSDVYENQLLLIEILAMQTGQKATDIQDGLKARSEQMVERLYRDALRRAGLADDDNGPDPNEDDDRCR